MNSIPRPTALLAPVVTSPTGQKSLGGRPLPVLRRSEGAGLALFLLMPDPQFAADTVRTTRWVARHSSWEKQKERQEEKADGVGAVRS
jgi:hypothetical protein